MVLKPKVFGGWWFNPRPYLKLKAVVLVGLFRVQGSMSKLGLRF